MNSVPWTPRPVKISLAQFAMDEEPSVNLATAIRYIEQAAGEKSDIVCLPELFRSPYFCRHERCERDYAEPLPGEVGEKLSVLAKKHSIAIVAGSVYERTADNQLFNTALVIKKDGTIAGTYRKTHVPQDPQFFEQFYFAAGDTGFKVFDLGFAKVSVLICYDQWFPEAARSAALAGAEIIFYPTAIGTVDGLPQVEGDWQNGWETVQRGHAVANSVVIAPVNRVGTEGDTTFWGGSFISDAFGKILAKGDNEPKLVTATVDLGHSVYTREGWRFFANRRPEVYGALTKR